MAPHWLTFDHPAVSIADLHPRRHCRSDQWRTASAITATTPDVTQFRTARDYAAWMGLTPRQHSSGGRERIGGISKMGDRYLRKLLYLGALARIRLRRQRGEGDDWIWRLLERKPAKVAAIAIANKMARTIWALLKTGQSYRAAL